MVTQRTTRQSESSYSTRAAELKRFWEPRNTQFREWYKRLRLDNNLKQANMESFISNDPKTLYNLAQYLLTASPINHNIPIQDAPIALSQILSQVEVFVQDSWKELDIESRSKGRQDWLSYLSKLMLATGWYAVFHIATEEGLIADIWNPAEAYPEYADGLTSIAHIYQLPNRAAKIRANKLGWPKNAVKNQGSIEVIDFWERDENGEVINAILLDGKFVKQPTPHPEFDGIIPVYCSPIGGLPDNGAIDESEDNWKKAIGESIVATNEFVYENYNRQLTFLQQILRDTAQPKFKERSRSRSILSSENVFKRGAIFRMDIDEDVGIIDMPSIPAELRTQLFDIQNMIQRGGFPYALYGNLQGDVAGFVMSQIAAAATQVLKPFQDAISNLLTDIDNSWIRHMGINNVRPRGYALPPGFPSYAKFTVDLRVQIPGDLALRASTARQLDPQFTLSDSTVTDLLFPEIRDPNQEIALRQRDEALRHPVAAQIALINALREQGEALIQSGAGQTARLYMATADQLEQQLAGPAPQQGGPPPPQVTGPSGPGTNIEPRQ